MHRAPAIAWLLALAACAPLLPQPLPDVLILGEQHDAPAHQKLHAQVVTRLAREHELAGLAIEMATQGTSTAALVPAASELQVRDALGWSEKSWDWDAYAPAVMAAVRAGVPVAGADLTREQLTQAAADSTLEARVSPDVLRAQVEDVRDGHCGLLPDAQLLPLARAQIARDRAFAHAVARLAIPGKTAVLITGGRHADARLGVALHLPRELRSVSKIWPEQPQAADYCAQLRERFRSPAHPSPG